MERIATKTLAEIYYQQGHLKKAYEIYRILSQKNPEDIEINKRLNELENTLGISSRYTQSIPTSKEEKIDILKKWLENIRKRKNPNGSKKF